MNKSIGRKIAALLLVLSLVVTAGVSSIFAAGEATEAQKAETVTKLKELRAKNKITEEALNEFIKQANAADALDVLEDILGEAGYFDEEPEVDPLAKQKAETVTKLKELRAKNKITEEALNEFIKQANAADALDVLEDILGEAGYFDEEPEVDPLAKQKAGAKEKLKSLKNAGRLTEDQLNEFVAQVEKADALDVIEDILAEAGFFDEKPGVPLTPMFPAEEDEDEDETSIPLTPLTPAEKVEESKEETSEESKEETTEESKDKNDKKDGTTVTSTEKNPGTSDMGIALSAITLLTSAGAYVFTSKKKEDK